MSEKRYKEPSKYLTAVSSGGGRPKLLLNEEGKQMVEILAGYFCTDEDIAETLKTSVDLLTNKNNRVAFAEAKKRGMSKGRTSLRRYQFKLAERNVAMAIFLGKNYLGQSDAPQMVDVEEQEKKADRLIDALKNTAKTVTEDDADIPELTDVAEET